MVQHANRLLAGNCLLITVLSTQTVPICFGQSHKSDNGEQKLIEHNKSDVKPSRDQFDQAIAVPQGGKIAPAAISGRVVAGDVGETSATTDCNGLVSFTVLRTLTTACLQTILPTESAFFSLSRSFPERRDQSQLEAWSLPIRDTLCDAGEFLLAGIEQSNRFGAIHQTYLAVRFLADELDQAR